MNIPSFKEDHISQIPAIQLLMNMGLKYLSPEKALEERGGKKSNVLLAQILDQKLREINKIEFKGQYYEFSSRNITNAIEKLKFVPYDGLVRTNEKIFDLLMLGESFQEVIQGNIKSPQLKYIDWENIENNVFHVTEEFEVETSDGKNHCRPDIVLFVNGIPLVVIECKRPDDKEPIEQAISQQIRNQRNEYIPRLFIYTQLLLVISKNNAKYGTVGTSEKYWAVWKERESIEDKLKDIINSPLSPENKQNLFESRFKYVQDYFNQIETQGRLVTYQDKILYSLCRPDRLLELVRQFIVFDCGEKKIARYQQYFAVKNALKRVKQLEDYARRKGGVIWHTQGSGKSITMVMIAKALALDCEIQNPRIVIVTDRVNLDRQIYNTFRHCGMEPVQAKSGTHLLHLLENKKKSIITSVIDKFEAGLRRKSVKNDSNNIFVLVDESHRSQYGTSHAKMRKVLPNACYIGFTGTPLMKKEKSTAIKFGGFIDVYTIDEAVKDKSVVPLLYEGRHALQEVNKKSIDKWFERVCDPLNEKQIVELKKKFSKIEKLNEAERVIYMLAYDISEHYSQHWKKTGFKAQLATSSKVAALKYKKFLDEIGLVSSEIIISPPDEREGCEDIYEDTDDELRKFWKTMMERFGNEKNYNDQLIESFKSANSSPEILIVVDKLLTGFDAPRNTVLYIAKPLREHSLLQAIARVNRIHEGKDYGFIIDYYGVLEELDKALTTYSALSEFDEDDLLGTLRDINEELNSLPQKHSELWDIFKSIFNRRDEEEYEQLLYDEEIRDTFYEKLSAFSTTLSIALSTTKFYDDYTDEQIQQYKEDLKFFQKLRASVKKRYADSIDHKEYEDKIKKLLDTYITSDEVIPITKLVDIFNKEDFEKEVSAVVGEARRADMIAHRTKKTIEEKIEEDPIFYMKFSKLIDDAIKDYREKRISEAEYLERVSYYMESVRNRKDDETPKILEDREVSKAFFGIVYETLKAYGDNKENKDLSANIALSIDDIVLKHKIVDWTSNQDIQNKIMNEIEDFLLDCKDLKLTYDEIDLIMEKVLNVAKIRYNK